MHISEKALRLLINSDISKLQALSYDELLTAETRQEMLNVFVKGNFLNTTEFSLQDPISLKNIKEACLVSSGHIFSKAIIDDILSQKRTDEEFRCPISREVLSKNIAGSGLAYVLLPKIDTILDCFDALRRSLFETVPHFSMKPDHVDKIGNMNVIVSRGRMKLTFTFDEVEDSNYDKLVSFLEFRIPGGEINFQGSGYYMDSKQFGRCWSKSNKNVIMLNFWFPTQNDIQKNQQTWNEEHLNDILSTFSSILHLPIVESPLLDIEKFSLEALGQSDRILALDTTTASFDQMLLCIHRFLRSTELTAKNLGFLIVDIPIQGSGKCLARSDLRPGYFGSRNDVLTTSNNITTSIQIRK